MADRKRPLRPKLRRSVSARGRRLHPPALADEAGIRALFEHLPLGLYRLARDGRILEANPALVAILGCPDRRCLFSHPVRDFFVSEKNYRQWLARLEREETIHDFEGPARRHDGRLIWVRHRVRVVRDRLGRVRYYEGAIEDISAQHRAQQALIESERRLRAVLEALPVGVWVTDGEGRIVHGNPAGRRIWAGTPFVGLEEHGVYRHARADRGPPIAPQDRALARALLEGEPSVGEEIEIEGPDGTRRCIWSSAAPIRDARGRITGAVVVNQDLTERKCAEERLQYLAHYDSLTGLPNRMLFIDRLEQALIEADRHERLVGVAFLDLDRFKNINDTLGHDAGDLLLKAVAERLRSVVRQGDTVARLSGDEFTFVLSDMAHVDDAARVVQKILEAFTRPFSVAGRELYITASLGLTLYPFDDRDVKRLLRNADVAMYRAKETGRNTYQFYSAEMTAKASEHLALEQELREAIARSQFVLHYQPLVACGSGAGAERVVGVEALLRWQHPRHGLLGPEQFIPLAEETGLIVPIGEWVLHAACAQCRAWEHSGLPPLRVSVNLSARQFLHGDLLASVRAALDRSGLEAGRLELEITESVLIRQSDRAMTMLEALGALGVGLAIDDFGTGYSSLAYLKRLPLDTLKIDRSFVRDLPGDAGSVAIVQAVVALAHALGLRVVGEGVEHAEQVAFLCGLGCDAYQGYYDQRPVPAQAIAARLAAAAPLPGSGA